MKPGGLYFIEDLFYGRHPGSNYMLPGHINMNDIILGWIDQLLVPKEKPVDSKCIQKGPMGDVNCGSDYFTAYEFPVPEDIEFINCFAKACVIGKK